MDRVVLLFCSLLSCGIIINIMFQFLDERCERIYQSRILTAVVHLYNDLL